ncbi:MAG: hypothetical protein EBX41_03980, partial [Chitinophagia bacterium]|nr:hypothetical protein [Chitinophagia bacterium]
NKVFIYPVVLVQYALKPNKMWLTAGWKTGVTKNTMQELCDVNPYLLSYATIKQAKKENIYLNWETQLGKHDIYSAEVGLMLFNNKATFINNPLSKMQFNILYQNASALYLSMKYNYIHSNKWDMSISADYYNFYAIDNNADAVWHTPNLMAKLKIGYHPADKWYFNVYGIMQGGITAWDSGAKKTLAPTIDLAASGEYEILRRLNVFLQLNNCLNQKNERFYGYNSYGFNIYGGIRLKF